jgi:hypothetical protein
MVRITYVTSTGGSGARIRRHHHAGLAGEPEITNDL